MEKLNLPVEEFTTPDPVTAFTETPIEELIRIMSENGVRHVPILSGDQVVGVVSERDLKLVAALDASSKSLLTAGDIMSRDPVMVSSQDTLHDVAFEMSRRKIGSVIVNEGDKLLGIFTSTDALNALVEITAEERR